MEHLVKNSHVGQFFCHNTQNIYKNNISKNIAPTVVHCVAMYHTQSVRKHYS